MLCVKVWLLLSSSLALAAGLEDTMGLFQVSTDITDGLAPEKREKKNNLGLYQLKGIDLPIPGVVEEKTAALVERAQALKEDLPIPSSAALVEKAQALKDSGLAKIGGDDSNTTSKYFVTIKSLTNETDAEEMALGVTPRVASVVNRSFNLISTHTSANLSTQEGVIVKAKEEARIAPHVTKVVMEGWDFGLTITMLVLYLLFAVVSFPDMHSFYQKFQLTPNGQKSPEVNTQKEVEEAASAEKPEPRSMMVILALTSFRFATGFESGTWLPYLLAREGEELWGDNQALFMSCAKLVYGFVILMNPLFGLLSDRLAMRSHALSRRLFVRVGMILAAMGIFICHWAAPRGHFWIFGWGVLIWRLGQGFNDITTEAICPEILPPEQYQLASSIKAFVFLLGALSGYALLLCMEHVHYGWLYHGYLITMFLCGLPCLFFIQKDSPKAMNKSSTRSQRSFVMCCVDAYINPALYGGGFPALCLCMFIFGCGSSPMFYFCLLIRDLAGIKDPVQLQMHFSLTSILFFLSAAIASVVNAWASPKKKQPEGQEGQQRIASPAGEKAASFRMMALAAFSFGVITFCLPFVRYFHFEFSRLAAFYVISSMMGFCFGVAYARFQDAAWQLLPEGADTANAMGFFLLTRLLGGALGNFVAGLILDILQNAGGGGDTNDGTANYNPMGYIALCTGCTLLAFFCGMITISIPMRFFAKDDSKKPEKLKA